MKNLNELKEAISTLLHYNRDEKLDWEQCVAYGDTSGQPEYDPALWPEHIYHTIRKLEQFVNEPGE